MVLDASSNDSNQRVFRQKLGRILGRSLKKDKKILIKQVAAYVNVGERTVKCWLAGESQPTPFQIGQLAKLIGTNFISELYSEILNEQNSR